jgi:hypothetical protein
MSEPMPNVPTPPSASPQATDSNSSKKPFIYSIIGAIAVIAAVFGLNLQKSGTPQTAQEPISPEPSPTGEDAVEIGMPAPTEDGKNGTEIPEMIVYSNYKNGTYTAQGDYTYHSGSESITITITLKDGIITDSAFEGIPKATMSARFMAMFDKGYKELIVGKNIDEVNLTKVSGSSRTPIGFNDALAKIKAQAKM